jgi:hypothetical protein
VPNRSTSTDCLCRQQQALIRPHLQIPRFEEPTFLKAAASCWWTMTWTKSGEAQGASVRDGGRAWGACITALIEPEAEAPVNRRNE